MGVRKAFRMTLIRWLLSAVAAYSLPLAGARSATSPAVDYRVAPVLSGGRLSALDVTMRFDAAGPGRVTLVLPHDNAPGHPHLTGLAAEGGELSDAGADERTLGTTKAGPVVVRYRLSPGSDKDPDSESRAPIIRPGWFAVHGESAFITIAGRSRLRATVTYGPGPQGWLLASSFRGPTTLGQVTDGLLLGGRGYSELSSTVAGSPLRLVYPAQMAARAAQALKDIARVDRAEREFWRAPPEPFFVGVIPLSDDEQFSGRGLDGGFALFLGGRVRSDAWLHLLAHEHMHTWISRRIGGFPTAGSDLEAWLNEGFTEAFTARVLLGSGLWTSAQFVADQNEALMRYGLSPVKNAPNTRILADRERDFDVNRLPYDRGRLLALVWDRRLRAATRDRIGLAKVMRAQIGDARGVAPQLSADLLFPRTVRRLTGVDLRPDIHRYVDGGDTIALPADLFGRCATVIDVEQPSFDRGFDLDQTLRAHGHVRGLEPDGPAARAGLRDDDHVLVDEVPSRDSQTWLSYVIVEPAGGRHTVKYKPEGRGEAHFQRLELTAAAHTDPAGCDRELARP